SSAGSVGVTVTNSAGTSASASATLLALAPALFASGGFVAAVKPDGTVVNSTTVAAKPGDILELYGTGFGPTVTPVAAGAVFSGSAPTTNMVTVTIGGVPASVSYSGLVGTGLYQLNATVPPLANGTYPVIATVGEVNTQTGVSLKITG